MIGDRIITMSNKKSSIIFGPGIKLMKQINFPIKMLILISILMIPIMMLSYFLHVEIKKNTDFAEGEARGLQYVLPLSEILIELTEEISSDFSSQKMQQQIMTIDKNDEKLGRELKTTETWNELKSLLQKQAPGSRQVAIDKTLDLIAKVGDNSALVLDPDLDSYYIMDASIVKYPEILNKTRQLSSMAVDELVKPTRTVDDQIKIAMIEGAIRSTLDGAKTGINNATKANATLKDGVLVFNESGTATVKLLQTVNNALSTVAEISSPGKKQEIIDQLKQTNAKDAVAYRLYLKQLDELLGKRINEAKNHQKNVFIALIIALLVVVYLLVALYHSFNETITNMLVGTQKFADGDWRDEISISSTDELGKITSSINRVREEIRVVICDILNSSQQVAGASQQLNASSEQMAQVADQVASAINEVASGANDQLSSLSQSTEAIEDLSASIQQVATNTNLVSSSSEQTANAARNGTVAITTAMKQITNIEIAVGDSASIVEKLGERSQEIGQIVDTISGIAGQTNLLALNAAIEAARAGEQGRGFAVVAEEVRKLAEQSQEATKQIGDLIGQIQRETEKAVEAMHMGTKEVKTGTQVVNAAGQAFEEIVVLIHQVTAQIHENSATIQEMASDSQIIVSSVQDVAAISKKAASQTQNLSAATEEQLATMEEVASSSQSLAKLAVALQDEVSIFKI